MTELEPNSSSGRLQGPQSESRLARLSLPAGGHLLALGGRHHCCLWARRRLRVHQTYDDADYVVENVPVQAATLTPSLLTPQAA